MPDNTSNEISVSQLKKILTPLHEIEKITFENHIFYIESTKDLSSSIAKLLIESGLNINFLHQKEFGLDEIYYQYFEGGN